MYEIDDKKKDLISYTDCACFYSGVKLNRTSGRDDTSCKYAKEFKLTFYVHVNAPNLFVPK